MRRVLALLTVLLALATLSPTASAGARDRYSAPAPGGAVKVNGAVSSPATYSARQIAAQPPLAVRTSSGETVIGASVQTLADRSRPRLDSGKNAVLRATITVRGDRGTARFAVGELDRGFGDHPALLTVSGGRVDLVVPEDRATLRSVRGVRMITVGVVAIQAVTAKSPGQVQFRTPQGTRVLTRTDLSTLPQEERTVTFQSGSGSQTHTVRGPSLSVVLLRAGVLPSLRMVVAAGGADGYGALVTPAEAYVGDRPLLLALTQGGQVLTQPRLIPDGDHKGGRYVSDVTTIGVTGR